MFVEHDAARLIQHLPSALPRKVSEIGVFQVEGLEHRIEASEFEELVAIECAASAASVEARIQIGHSGVVPMPHPKHAVLPPSLCQPRLFAQFLGVAEEDLARDREYE